MDIYYEKVEKILSRFPLSWQKNYYQNKKSLIVNYEKGEIKSTAACYNHEQNIVTVYNKNYDASVHELFHMSFRDENKVRNEITDGIIYGNGVSLKDIVNEKKFLVGITEGFAEYLSRQTCVTCKGYNISYFFTDLLLFVFGEEILEYSFHNDPLGFIKDDRFYNLSRFTRALDNIEKCAQEFENFKYIRSDIERVRREDYDAWCGFMEGIGKNIRIYNQSIAEVYSSIIEEYHMYSQRYKIEKEIFIHKLSSFCTDSDYRIAFVFDKEHVLQKKLSSFMQSV